MLAARVFWSRLPPSGNMIALHIGSRAAAQENYCRHFVEKPGTLLDLSIQTGTIANKDQQ